MQVVIVALAAVVLGVGILSSNHTQTSDDQLTATETPLVEVSVLGIDSSPSPESSSTPEPSETADPTNTPTQEPTAKPTQQPNNISLSQYMYPGSTVVSSSSSKLELTTGTDPNTVSDWYRSLVKTNGFSVTSSIKTSTNEIVNNKLVAAKGDQQVSVNVSKKNGSTVIVVEVNN